MARTVARRKSRGAYFTPTSLASFMADWAIRNPNDRILDPAAGEGALLTQAARRLGELGATRASNALIGIEVNAYSARKAAQLPRASITKGDAFRLGEADVGGKVSVILSNPPWVRYHSFTGRRRLRALRAASAAGVVLNARSSFWAPYLVHALSFLHADGRLAVVLPAEFLTVDYAGPVRDILARTFRSMTVVRFSRPAFREAEVDALLLLADNVGPIGVRHIWVNSVDDLSSTAILPPSRFNPAKLGKRWSDDEVCAKADQLIMRLQQRDDVITLGEIAHVSLGIVTGAKPFFVLSDSEVRENRLSRRSLVPILPGARDIRALVVTRDDWAGLRTSGGNGWLLRCRIPPEQLNGQAVGVYIRKGERDGANVAFKCRVRSPWYQIEVPLPPDAFLTYLGADRIRLIANKGGLVATNLLHHVRWKRPFRRGQTYGSMPAVFLSSLTQVAVELLGRAYGGGVIKIEPSDAKRLPIVVPNPSSRLMLGAEFANLDRLVRGRKEQQAAEVVDRILLSEQLGLSVDEIRSFAEARDLLVSQRHH